MDPETRFRAVFELARPALARFVRHYGLGAADAEDLVAATLEVAWRRLDQVPTDDPLPWCFGVARNLWRNRRRAEDHRSAVVARLAVVHPPAPAGDVGALATEGIPDGAAILAALDRLGDDDRELLLLVAWDGLTPSQAATVLGCSPAAARTRLHRARSRLAAHLGLDPRRPRPSTSSTSPDSACTITPKDGTDG